VAVPPASVRVPSQRPLAPSVTSVTPVANDKGDNKVIPGAVHRSPSICLKAEENPGRPQKGDRLMKALFAVLVMTANIMTWEKTASLAVEES
jgi:hypothetical protein